MSSAIIAINFDGDKLNLDADTSKPKEWCKLAEHFFKSINAGLVPANTTVITSATSGVNASATLTCATVVNDNTCVVAGVTLTAKASPSGIAQFLRSANNTTQAAAIAACINANTSLNGIVTATSALAVVTVSCALPGPIGNKLTLVGTVTTLEASAATLGSGAGVASVPVTYALGK